MEKEKAEKRVREKESGKKRTRNVCTCMGVNVWLGTHLIRDQRLKGNEPHRKLGGRAFQAAGTARAKALRQGHTW